MACKCPPGCTTIPSQPESKRCQCGGYETGGAYSACIQTTGSFSFPSPTSVSGGSADRCASMTGTAKTNCIQSQYDLSHPGGNSRTTLLGGAGSSRPSKKETAAPRSTSTTQSSSIPTATSIPTAQSSPTDNSQQMFGIDSKWLVIGGVIGFMFIIMMVI